MKLYSSPFSSNSRRALMTAIHLGVDLELKVVDLQKGGHKSPDFLKINAKGRIPVLDDDGFILDESHAIMRYLAESVPGQTLYPAAEARRGRADVDRWLFWSAAHFQPAIGILNRERIIKPLLGLGDPDPVLEKKGETDFLDGARFLDAHLAANEWIAQDRLTLADFAVAAALTTLHRSRLPVTGLASLTTWLRRIELLDAWKRTAL